MVSICGVRPSGATTIMVLMVARGPGFERIELSAVAAVLPLAEAGAARVWIMEVLQDVCASGGRAIVASPLDARVGCGVGAWVVVVAER